MDAAKFTSTDVFTMAKRSYSRNTGISTSGSGMAFKSCRRKRCRKINIKIKQGHHSASGLKFKSYMKRKE